MCLVMEFKSSPRQWVSSLDNMTPEEINLVLREIQASIPKQLLDLVVTKQPLTPTIKKVAELTLNEDIPDWKRQQIKDLLASGDLDHTVETENYDIGDKINAYVQRQLNKAIREKRLPSKKELKKILYENKKTTS